MKEKGEEKIIRKLKEYRSREIQTRYRKIDEKGLYLRAVWKTMSEIDGRISGVMVVAR